LPLGQVVELAPAGARDVKTSKAAVPLGFPLALPEAGSAKWNSHVFPFREAGKSKVSSVVRSALWPSLKILPEGES
jgi:hypothetical protein